MKAKKKVAVHDYVDITTREGGICKMHDVRPMNSDVTDDCEMKHRFGFNTVFYFSCRIVWLPGLPLTHSYVVRRTWCLTA